MDQLLESLDEPTCIRLACLDADVASEGDFSSWKSSAKKLDAYVRINADLVASLIAALRTRVVRLEGECKSLSISTGDRIINAVSEYKSIISSCSDIQRHVNDMTASMQRLGGDFSERIQALVDLDMAYARMHDTKAILRITIDILKTFKEMSESIKNGELYHAAKLYRKACDTYKGPLTEATSMGWFDEDPNQGEVPNWDGPDERSFLRENIGYLAPFLLTQFDSMEINLDQAVTTMFNQWLIYGNEQALNIGLDAMHECEIEHHIRRRHLVEQKASWEDLQRASSQGVAVKLLVERIQKLKYDSSAMRTPVNGKRSSRRLSLKLLSKAVSVKCAYSECSSLLQEYMQARDGQLGSMLVPPDSESTERAYLAQLVGFFMIESEVCKRISNLDTQGHLKTVWEGASAAVSAELGAMLDEVSSVGNMLELKWQSLYACQALERFGVDIINTNSIRSAIKKRISRLCTLLHEPTMAKLENADGDAELLKESVAYCFEEIAKYFDGLVPQNSINTVALIEAEKVICKLLQEIFSSIGDQNSYDNAESDEVLSFIETLDFMKGVLLEHKQGEDRSVTLESMDRLMESAVSRLSKSMAQTTVLQACNAMHPSPQEFWNINKSPSGGNLISAWCDSMIEQVEFYRGELGEFGFSQGVEKSILTSYISCIVSEIMSTITKYGGNMTGIGAYALYCDLQALEGVAKTVGVSGQETGLLVDLILLFKSIAFGDVESILSVGKDQVDEFEKLKILILKKVTDSTEKSEVIQPIDKTIARKLAKQLEN